jgi:hypothetical protein
MTVEISKNRDMIDHLYVFWADKVVLDESVLNALDYIDRIRLDFTPKLMTNTLVVYGFVADPEPD